jgi:hypothetical protein
MTSVFHLYEGLPPAFIFALGLDVRPLTDVLEGRLAGLEVKGLGEEVWPPFPPKRVRRLLRYQGALANHTHTIKSR